jgi:hypothetical protein
MRVTDIGLRKWLIFEGVGEILSLLALSPHIERDYGTNIYRKLR